MFSGSGNSFQVLPNAQLRRITLKFKVTWFWTRLYLSQLLHMLTANTLTARAVKVSKVMCKITWP